jgi:hypothetical protein
VRRALVVVLLASGLKLLDASVGTVVLVLAAVAVVGPVLWAGVWHRSRPGGTGRATAPHLLAAAVTGRWLSWGGWEKPAEARPRVPR